MISGGRLGLNKNGEGGREGGRKEQGGKEVDSSKRTDNFEIVRNRRIRRKQCNIQVLCMIV